MRIVRTTLGAVASAAITGALFLAGPIGVALVSAPVPVASLPPPEPPRVVHLPAELLEPAPEDHDAEDADGDGGERGTGDAEQSDGAHGEAQVADGTVPGGRMTRPGSGGTPRGKTGPSRMPPCAEPTPAIQELGVDRFAVERAFVESYTGDMARLNTLGRVYKHVGADGRPDGLVVRRIRCGSPLHQGGLRDGDVVHAVNGKRLKNLVQAVVVYNKLKDEQVFRVELTRDGRRRRIVYRLT